MQSKRALWGEVAVIVLLATVFFWFGPAILPKQGKGVSDFSYTVFCRCFVVIVNLAIVNALFPGAIKRAFSFRFDKRGRRGLALLIFLCAPYVQNSHLSRGATVTLFQGLVIVFFIGLCEETLSRLLIFSAFRKVGFWSAAILSSIHFGLLHYGNVIFVGQSFSFTSTQVVSACSSGLLLVALMLYTRSLWPPIILHAVIDLPMELKSPDFQRIVTTGTGSWYPIVLNSIFYSSIAIGLLFSVRRYDKAQVAALPAE